MPELRATIIGGPWLSAQDYFEHLKSYSKEKVGNGISFLGTRSDVPDLYPDLDVVVHPSMSDNVGGTGESLASGVPTIATNTGGFPDFVRPGISGWLVPPRAPEAIAAAILDVFADPARARKLTRAGQKLAREGMDVQRTASEVGQIHREILSRYTAK